MILTVVRRDENFFNHLTGTNFYYELNNERINHYKQIWEQEIVSENKEVYRAEYLAYLAFKEYQKSKDFDVKQFILKRVEQNYSESYLKGVHDFDALRIYQNLWKFTTIRNFIFPPAGTVAAQLFWHSVHENDKASLWSIISTETMY